MPSPFMPLRLIAKGVAQGPMLPTMMPALAISARIKFGM